MSDQTTTTTVKRPDHGTPARHWAYGCHCPSCLSAPAVTRLASRAQLGISRLPRPVVDLTVPHGYLRYRDQGCRCLTCVDAYATHRRDVKTQRQTVAAEQAEQRRAQAADRAEQARRRKAEQRARQRQDEKARRALAPPPAPVSPYRFETYAAHPAQPPTVTTTAKSVICCELEAIEDEGTGHFDCPRVTTGNHRGGDAA